jgi:hypothetical protein
MHIDSSYAPQAGDLFEKNGVQYSLDYKTDWDKAEVWGVYRRVRSSGWFRESTWPIEWERYPNKVIPRELMEQGWTLVRRVGLGGSRLRATA